MNRYVGNSGIVERIPEDLSREVSGERYEEKTAPFRVNTEKAPHKKPSGLSDILGGLGGLGSKIGTSLMDTDEILLGVLLYLLYRESGDIEFLLIAGAMLFM